MWHIKFVYERRNFTQFHPAAFKFWLHLDMWWDKGQECLSPTIKRFWSLRPYLVKMFRFKLNLSSFSCLQSLNYFFLTYSCDYLLLYSNCPKVSGLNNLYFFPMILWVDLFMGLSCGLSNADKMTGAGVIWRIIWTGLQMWSHTWVVVRCRLLAESSVGAVN